MTATTTTPRTPRSTGNRYADLRAGADMFATALAEMAAAQRQLDRLVHDAEAHVGRRDARWA
jgi:hypothetical protein